MKVNLNVSNSHSQGPQKGLADRKSHPCCSQSSPWKKEGWDNRLGEPFSLPPWPHSRDGDMSMRPGQRLESWLGIACLDTRPRVLGLMNNVCFQSDGLLLPPSFTSTQPQMMAYTAATTKLKNSTMASTPDVICHHLWQWRLHTRPKQKTRQMERLQNHNKGC